MPAAGEETTYFQTLSAEVIRTYLARIQPLDKAGGYAIQEHAELILSELKGSFTNVVGLPVERLRTCWLSGSTSAGLNRKVAV